MSRVRVAVVPVATVLLLAVTLGVTVLRAVRWPNDFAEAHWLLDYRVGLVKRGLPGQLLALVSEPFGGPSEALIAGLAVLLFTALCAAWLWLAVRVIAGSGGSLSTVLALMAVLSSPYIVMSAHLMGYLDHLIVLLAVAAVWSVLAGRMWTAGVVAAIAVLVHENMILVGLPVLLFAWWLRDTDGRTGGGRLSAFPLVLPLVAFAVLAIAGSVLVPGEFQDALVPHIGRFAFVAGDMHIFVPEWLSESFAANVSQQYGHFPARIASAEMHGLIVPTTMALLAVVATATPAPRAIELGVAVTICVAPQVMHLAAWDTVRIWTFTIVVTYLVLWVWTETRGLDTRVSRVVGLLALVALAGNVVSSTPLYDNLADRFTVGTRVLLYLPVLCGAAWIARRSAVRPA